LYKEVPYLNLPREDNSFLGIRGIRFCLARPDLFIPQLRALYRAAAYGPLNITFPMIATLEDWRQARCSSSNAPSLPRKSKRLLFLRLRNPSPDTSDEEQHSSSPVPDRTPGRLILIGQTTKCANYAA
jgi:hypothetical protein